MNQFAGKAAVVTGAGRGIGRAIALALGREGVRVLVNFLANAAAAEAVVAEIKSAGGQALAVQADVRQLEDVKRLAAAAKEAFGGVDILVNNAGILRDNLVAFMSEEEWDEVMDTSAKGAFLCAKVLARDMARRKWGRIITIASAAGLMGDVMRANYAAAKAAEIGLTKALARELAASGITVNAVAPGVIETDMTASTNEAKRVKQLDTIPLKRFGKPEEVASLVTYLASDAAGYITGQVISIDGGLHIG